MRRFVMLLPSFVLVGVLGVVSFVSSAAAQPDEASFEGLGDLPGGIFRSQAFDVSGGGSVVVGYSYTDFPFEAFRWENGEIESLGDLEGGDNYSRAEAVSLDGSVVVGASISGNGTEAFRWQDGEMEGLGDLPGEDFGSRAEGISDDGTIVVGSGSSGEDDTEAFRWTADEGMVPLGDIEGGEFHSIARDVTPDGSVITGRGTSSAGTEAYRWENGTMEGLGDLPGGNHNSQAFALSNDGSVVVGFGNSDAGTEAFRWEGGEMEGLGFMEGGGMSRAQAVSGDGSVVIGYGSSTDGFRAFVWTAEDGMRILQQVLEEEYDIDLTGWTLSRAYGISSDGSTIVGYGSNPDGDTEAWRASGLFPVADASGPDALAERLSVPRPNPARETFTFTVSVERGQNVSVDALDVTGRRMETLFEGAITAGTDETLVLDASSFPAGVYLIRATGEDFAVSRRVTVIR